MGITKTLGNLLHPKKAPQDNSPTESQSRGISDHLHDNNSNSNNHNINSHPQENPLFCFLKHDEESNSCSMGDLLAPQPGHDRLKAQRNDPITPNLDISKSLRGYIDSFFPGISTSSPDAQLSTATSSLVIDRATEPGISSPLAASSATTMTMTNSTITALSPPVKATAPSTAGTVVPAVTSTTGTETLILSAKSTTESTEVHPADREGNVSIPYSDRTTPRETTTTPQQSAASAVSSPQSSRVNHSPHQQTSFSRGRYSNASSLSHAQPGVSLSTGATPTQTKPVFQQPLHSPAIYDMGSAQTKNNSAYAPPKEPTKATTPFSASKYRNKFSQMKANHNNKDGVSPLYDTDTISNDDEDDQAFSARSSGANYSRHSSAKLESFVEFCKSFTKSTSFQANTSTNNVHSETSHGNNAENDNRPESIKIRKKKKSLSTSRCKAKPSLLVKNIDDMDRSPLIFEVPSSAHSSTGSVPAPPNPTPTKAHVRSNSVKVNLPRHKDSLSSKARAPKPELLIEHSNKSSLNSIPPPTLFIPATQLLRSSSAYDPNTDNMNGDSSAYPRSTSLSVSSSKKTKLKNSSKPKLLVPTQDPQQHQKVQVHPIESKKSEPPQRMKTSIETKKSEPPKVKAPMELKESNPSYPEGQNQELSEFFRDAIHSSDSLYDLDPGSMKQLIDFGSANFANLEVESYRFRDVGLGGNGGSMFDLNGSFHDKGFSISSEGITELPAGLRKRHSSGSNVDSPSQHISVKSLHEISFMENLGIGASGSVKLGVHTPSGRKVAIKSVNVWDDERRNQLLKELETLQMFSSRFLVTFYNAFYDGSGSVHIVLEYMSMGALSDIIAKYGPIPENVSKIITTHCLHGLHFLHQQRVLHRDFKTANILLSEESQRAKLSDFGLVRDFDKQNSIAHTFVGTLAYLSPERLQGGPYTYAGDIWGLGISVVECLLGKYPFEKPASYFDYMDITTRSDKFLPAGKFSPQCDDFVKICTKVNPHDRPTAEQLLKHPWICNKQDPREFEEWMVKTSNLQE